MPDSNFDSLYSYLKKYAPEFLYNLTPEMHLRLQDIPAAEGAGSNLALMSFFGNKPSFAGKSGPNIPGVGPRVRVQEQGKYGYDYGPTWVHESMHQLFTRNIPGLSQAWKGVPESRRQELESAYEGGDTEKFTSWDFPGGVGGAYEWLPTTVDKLADKGYDPSGLSPYEKQQLGGIFKEEALYPPLPPTVQGPETAGMKVGFGQEVVPPPSVATTPSYQQNVPATQQWLNYMAPVVTQPEERNPALAQKALPSLPAPRAAPRPLAPPKIQAVTLPKPTLAPPSVTRRTSRSKRYRPMTRR